MSEVRSAGRQAGRVVLPGLGRERPVVTIKLEETTAASRTKITDAAETVITYSIQARDDQTM